MKRTQKCLTLFLICLTLLSAVPVVIAMQSNVRKNPPRYKHMHRKAISKIAKGKHKKAKKILKSYFAEDPNDPETMYAFAVAYTSKRKLDKAMQYVGQALDAGLPFERFLAGPRNLLEPLTGSGQFQQLAGQKNIQLLHGPMLGCVTETSAKFWVRTADQVGVSVVVTKFEDGRIVAKSETVNTKRQTDYTAVAAVKGLKPNTQYRYRLIINGRQMPQQWSFRTSAPKGSQTQFKVGFGGGAGYTPEYERMWNTIGAHQLDAFLFLGDNVYIDHPEYAEVQQYCYYRRQSRPEFRRFVASNAIYAIYDDHDFGDNDIIGGPDIDKPAWKRPVWRTFRNNWNNPYYGGGETQPGCWFDFAIGDVDFFMLDGRYYRTNPTEPDSSMLGPVQKKWLLDKLAASKAAFKVIASPVAWAYGAKTGWQNTRRGKVPGNIDIWAGFKAEREEIFSFIEDNKIEGVILLSADRHRSDAWKISRPNGYDFYEFESSKLTNIHIHKLMPGSLFGYNEKCSFGLLSFDTTLPDPRITYQIISIDNEPVHTLTIRKSRLIYRKSK